MISSARPPRLRKGTPSWANSSTIQPMPAPSTTRPPESTAAVAMVLAVARGWRSGSTQTLVTKRSREVAPAMAAMLTHGSGQSVC